MTGRGLHRVEELLAQVERLADAPAREVARELAAAMVDAMGDGLARAGELAGEAGARAMADDELVGALLVLCDRHPDPAVVRADAAVRGASLAGFVVDGVDEVGDGAVRVRLRAAGIDARRPDAARAEPARATIERARAIVEAAVLARAPDVAALRVEVDGVDVVAPGLVGVGRLVRGDGAERCELCALPLAARHAHLYDPRARAVACACQGCALIVPSKSGAAWRRVPERRERVALDPAAWLERLGVPVGVAAIVVHDDGRVAVGYPGPAGLVEAEVDAEVWRTLGAEVPAFEREVEALVCSTLPDGGAWLVGIDVVFEMIGELRAAWRGPDAPAAIARVLEGGRARG